MAKEIKVVIVNKNELRIEESAEAGDIIRLDKLQNIDTSQIERAIEEGRESTFERKLIDALAKQRAEIEKEVQLDYSTKKAELENRIKDLENEAKMAETKKQLEIANAIKTKEDEIARLKANIEKAELNAKNELLEKEKELNSKHAEELNNANVTLLALQAKYDSLKQGKQILSNKEVGEDLEVHCTELVNNMMQIGFDNCTWEKDNDAIKEDGEVKGTKADFVYKVFLDNSHSGSPLTSVCLEMKNERLESTTKKKNADHYAKLDKDRNKKQCKFALLVSNLEMDNDNILPIYKVREYSDMYAVRPNYLTTFLTIITSLTMKFKDIIVADRTEKMNLASQLEFINKFDELKETYLDKPLIQLDKEVGTIKKSNESIKKAYYDIEKACDNILNKYMSEITNKLDKYYNGIIKTYKKLEK